MAVLWLQGGLSFLGVSNLPCIRVARLLWVMQCWIHKVPDFEALEISGIYYVGGLFHSTSSFPSVWSVNPVEKPALFLMFAVFKTPATYCYLSRHWIRRSFGTWVSEWGLCSWLYHWPWGGDCGKLLSLCLRFPAQRTGLVNTICMKITIWLMNKSYYVNIW